MAFWFTFLKTTWKDGSKTPLDCPFLKVRMQFRDLYKNYFSKLSWFFQKGRFILSIFKVWVSFLLKAITQSILGQNQHPGPFLGTREQELSFGTLGLKIG